MIQSLFTAAPTLSAVATGTLAQALGDDLIKADFGDLLQQTGLASAGTEALVAPPGLMLPAGPQTAAALDAAASPGKILPPALPPVAAQFVAAPAGPSLSETAPLAFPLVAGTPITTVAGLPAAAMPLTKRPPVDRPAPAHQAGRKPAISGSNEEALPFTAAHQRVTKSVSQSEHSEVGPVLFGQPDEHTLAAAVPAQPAIIVFSEAGCLLTTAAPGPLLTPPDRLEPAASVAACAITQPLAAVQPAVIPTEVPPSVLTAPPPPQPQPQPQPREMPSELAAQPQVRTQLSVRVEVALPEQPVAVSQILDQALPPHRRSSLAALAPPADALTPLHSTSGQPALPAPQLAPVTGARPHDFAALVDRLVAARDAVQPQTALFTVRHADFGPVQLRFRHEERGLAVSLASPDPEFARAAAAASPLNIAASQLFVTAADSGPPEHAGTAANSSGGSQSRGHQPERRGEPAPPAPQHTQSSAQRHTARRSGIFA